MESAHCKDLLFWSDYPNTSHPLGELKRGVELHSQAVGSDLKVDHKACDSGSQAFVVPSPPELKIGTVVFPCPESWIS